jgi:hypothetical protein
MSGRAEVLRLSPRVWSEKVPPVPFEIQEHGESPVWLAAWRGDELDAGGDQALVGGLEIIDAEKHSDAAGELPPHHVLLLGAIRAREQYAGLPALGSNNDPTLRPAIIGQRRGIFDKVEFQDIDKEPNRRVIIPNDQRDEFEVRHGSQITPDCPARTPARAFPRELSLNLRAHSR